MRSLRCLGLLLAAAGPLLGAAPAASATHVQGWALLGPNERISGGKVDVHTMDGTQITGGKPMRTSSTGTFSVPVTRLPKRYVVTVSGGRVNGWRVRGRLGVVVTGPRRGTVQTVTPITTLIAARVGRHGSVTRAEREIRRVLKLPSYRDLYDDQRIDGSAFDGGRFVRTAQRRGGLDRYVAAMARDLRVRPFRAATSRPRGASGQMRGVSGSSLPIDLAKELAGGLAGAAGSALASKFFQMIGMGTAAAEERIESRLAEIKAKLAELERQLFEIRRQMDQLSAQIESNHYEQLAAQTRMLGVGGPNDEIQANFAYLVDHAAACVKAGGTNCARLLPEGTTDPEGWCRATRDRTPLQIRYCETLELLRQFVGGEGLRDLQDSIVGSGAQTRGLLRVYQAARYQREVPRGYITTRYREDAKNVTLFWQWITVTAANYRLQYRAAVGASDESLLAGMNQTIADLGAQEKLLPNALPAGAAVNPRTRTVWRLLTHPRAETACGDTKSELLWFRPDWWDTTTEDRAGFQEACQAQWDRALAREGGGWVVPAVDELTAELGSDPAGRVKDGMGLADLRPLDRAYPALKPNFARVDHELIYGSNHYADNPGTSAGLGSSSCTRYQWNLGLGIQLWGDWYSLPVFGWFCSYVDARTGDARMTCLRWYQDTWTIKRDRYYSGVPCDAPASTYPVHRPGVDAGRFGHHGALDFGHPVAYLVKRPVTGTEGWFVTP